MPPLEADPGAIRSFAADLLAASAQLDDLGTFVAGRARVGDWQGAASTAYHDAIRRTGRDADAASLALRDIARRADHHADTMQRLLERRSTLDSERAHLVATLHAVSDDGARAVRTFEADLEAWAAEIAAEEAAMRDAFVRATTPDRVERHRGSVDPADAALASRPGSGATAGEVNAWWDGLTREQQLAVVAASPGAIGNRDGIPPWARDAANTVALDRDLAAWGALEGHGLLTNQERTWLENARAAQDARATIERGVDPVTGEPVPSQLYLYDPTAFGGDGAVAVSAGDLATAGDVSVLVPGFGTDGESAAYQAARVLTLHEACRAADGERSNASMVWIGYDAPDNVPWGEGWDAAGVVGEQMASAGGDRLADAIDGLRASHDGPPAHLTVIGHSYGSTTTGLAAHEHGLHAGDVVLVGSPGAGAHTATASDLGLGDGHVWVGAASRDPVSWLGDHGWVSTGSATSGGGLGTDPSTDDFGARRFEAESDDRAVVASLSEHDRYFDPGSESLHNISEIVTGHYGEVDGARPRHDPWFGPAVDPELVRDPRS
ncbi:MAG TPA: alpha/beta hydrolase [Nocardioides sp.]|nr:alpha/beta hydrolase [Nocardioides sp.]